jgi:hypothetical protein
LRDEQTKSSLSNQVLTLYEGYRTLVTDLIAKAQKRGICTSGFSPDAAASFLLAALNGMLISHLFLGGRSADLETGLEMLRRWLFSDTPGTAGETINSES